eukprot:SM004633S16155  [mRNA]  locus=s4633:482:1146:- [translate_table: standard]
MSGQAVTSRTRQISYSTSPLMPRGLTTARFSNLPSPTTRESTVATSQLRSS